MTTGNDWQARRDAYNASILASIPEDWRLPAGLKLSSDVRHVAETSGILTPAEVKILAQDATSLAAAIAERKYTAVEVATAYAKAAAVAHQTTHCLMDFFPEEALARAKELDEILERTGKTVGPMHGVPLSIKDMCGVTGRRMSGGYLSILEGPEGVNAADATIVAAFRKAGAVFFCKTSMPQGIMHLECKSFLGETTNPFNTALTPGGSSGGESALIAAGGSVLGIGSDIGGSIRNPCANCGLYGFKPSAMRLPKSGNMGGMPGQEAIVGAVGPMGVSARDMELFVATVLADEPWSDPSQVRMPWRPEEVKWIGGDKPRIGVMWDDGVCVPQPPMRRAMKLAVDKLKKAGFDVVDIKGYRTADGWDILKRLYFTDGGARVKTQCGKTGEPVLPLTEWIMDGAVDTPATDLFELVKERDAFRADYNAWWQKQNIDVLLLPPYPGPAPELGTSKYWMYTAMYNLTDYPGAVFPTPWTVEAGDVEEKREFLSEDDKLIASFYSPEKFVNAPLALQIVGMRWEDEKVMEALKIISKVVRE